MKQERCEHELVYDELHKRVVCKKCFHVLTRGEKCAALEYANALRLDNEIADAVKRVVCGIDLADEEGNLT